MSIVSWTAPCFAQVQSVLHPAGRNAAEIWTMWWVMAGGAAVIFTGVMALAMYSIFARPERRNPSAAMHFIRIGGVAFPIVTLTVLLVYTIGVGARLAAPVGQNDVEIEVVGRQWWWEVHYRAGEERITTANELYVPVGRPVTVYVTSPDVIHSFWVPNLAGKIDMIPGRTNRLTFEASEPGVYRGQCAEYCGLQHALMAFFVVAVPEAEFTSWLARQQQPAMDPRVPLLAAGRRAFLEAGCGACHTVRGTPANGEIGPDLTHVGSRRSLAAATLGNGIGHLAGWIADSQGLKPGNQMPSFNQIDGPSLRAIAAWLESLK